MRAIIRQLLADKAGWYGFCPVCLEDYDENRMCSHWRKVFDENVPIATALPPAEDSAEATTGLEGGKP